MAMSWLLAALFLVGCLGDSGTETFWTESIGEETDAVVPPGSTYSAVAAGEYYTLALRSDGRVYATGSNTYGQLGNGTKITTYSGAATQVSGLTQVTAIAAGCFHSLALTSNGTVWAWGYNYRGQLGNGNTTSQSTPVQVQGLPAIKVVAAGCYHSMAIDTSGYVWTWGSNGTGQLGNGSNVSATTPVKLPGFLASAVDGGELFSLALRTDGAVMAWGNNSYGQLGTGNTTSSTVPVANGLTSVTAIAAGLSHGIAVKNGQLLAWGHNAMCELGTGSSSPSYRTTPVVNNVDLYGPYSPSAGTWFNLVGSYDGFSPPFPGPGVLSWGYNAYGELGTGTTISSCQPTWGGRYQNPNNGVVFLSSDASGTLSAGGYHAVAVDVTGKVIAWGRNDFGQLGIGSTSSSKWAIATQFP